MWLLNECIVEIGQEGRRSETKEMDWSIVTQKIYLLLNSNQTLLPTISICFDSIFVALSSSSRCRSFDVISDDAYGFEWATKERRRENEKEKFFAIFFAFILLSLIFLSFRLFFSFFAVFVIAIVGLKSLPLFNNHWSAFAASSKHIIK